MPERTAIAERLALAAAVFVAGIPLAHADVEDQLESRWEGAWLIMRSELYSDCNGLSTNNQISGDLISGRGSRALPPGELGRVTNVNVKRHRVDVTVALDEPVLVDYRDGPFTLYREASCRVELMIDFGDERTKNLGAAAIEAQFAAWFDRYARREDAEQSLAWNQRERRDYPDDYEQTLADYRLWKVDQYNAAVDARIQESIDQTQRLIADVSADDDFGAGLSHGIAAMRSNIGDDCAQLVASTPDTWKQVEEAPSDAWGKGYETGQRLAYYVELGRELPGCFMDPDAFLTETSFTAR